MADITFFEALRNGLRPHSNISTRNSQFLIQCANLIPTEGGLKALPAVTYPISSPTISMTWPHMQLERAEKNTLLFTATAVYTVASDWTASAQTTYDAQDQANTASIPAGTGYWQVAGFHDSWFATKGNALVYKIPSNTSDRVVVEGSSAVITVQALANHQNRLVLGGLAGSQLSDSTFTDLFSHWRENSPDDIVVDENSTTINTGYVYWSAPGGGDNDIPYAAMMSTMALPSTTVFTNKFKEFVYSRFTRENGREMGFLPLKYGGTIYVIKPWGNDLIVYAQNSVSRLVWTEDGYREQVLLTHGVAGRGAVGGNDKVHVFVSKQGEVFSIGRQLLPWGQPAEDNGIVWRYGYDEFVGALTDASIVVCHDPQENYFSIADGTNGYWLTRTGLGKGTAIMPSSLLRMSGTDGLVGTHITAADPQAVAVETELFDGGMREPWEVAYVNLASTDTDSTGWTVAAKYRFKKNASLTTPSTFTTLLDGRARVKTSGIEFTVLLANADRTKCDLDRLDVEVGRGKPSMRKWLDV